MSELTFPVPLEPNDTIPSRVFIGFDQANTDLALKNHGISHKELGAAIPHESPDFVNDMIINNLDVWNQLISHAFCAAMASGTALLDGFRYYMIQDLFYLRNSVRTRLGLYHKLSYKDWSVLNQAGPEITKSVSYAEAQLSTCLSLGLTQDQVEKTEPAEAATAYINWQNQEIDSGDWFSLHVMMLPCIIGYDQIARKLDAMGGCLKNTIYYKMWISQNISVSSVARYRKFCNENMKLLLSNSTGDPLMKWRKLFRTACEHEIQFFNTGLSPPRPYDIIPEGDYVIRSAMTATVMNLDGGSESMITGWAMNGEDKQTWYLECDIGGYLLKNKANNLFAAAVQDANGQLVLRGKSTGDRFYISPSYPNLQREAQANVVTFQIILAESQNLVVDLSGGLSDNGTELLAYNNYMTTNNQGGANQAWYFDRA